MFVFNGYQWQKLCGIISSDLTEGNIILSDVMRIISENGNMVINGTTL